MKFLKTILTIITFTLVFFASIDGKEKLVFDQKTQMPKINELRVSSILADDKDRYIGTNIIDGTINSWAEGVNGPGIGENIMILFEAPVKLSCFYIKNGFGVLKWFNANNRVKDLEFESSVIFSEQYEKKKFVITLKDAQELVRIDLPESIVCRDIKLTIRSVYKGSRFDDTCISEISFKPVTISDKPQHSAITKPVKLNAMGYNLVLYPEGKMTGEGYGQCQLDCKFSRGYWGATNDGGFYLNVVQMATCYAKDAKDADDERFEVIEAHNILLLDKLESPE